MEENIIFLKCLFCKHSVVVGQLYHHIRAFHRYENICVVCGKKLHSVGNLSLHKKLYHAHLVGFQLPPDAVLDKKRQERITVNRNELIREYEKLNLPKGRETLVLGEENDDYLSFYDYANNRPAMTFEVLTPDANAIDGEVKKLTRQPFLDDEAVPGAVDPNLFNQFDKEGGHLATRSFHRKSTNSFKKTFLAKNIVPIWENANKSLLRSVEELIYDHTLNWWKVIVITFAVYSGVTESKTINGLTITISVPDSIVKIVILGDLEMQIFLIPNTKVSARKECSNFMICRESLENVNRITDLNFSLDYQMTWDRDIYKCVMCRDFFTNDLFELQVHSWFQHEQRSCPCKKCKKDDLNYDPRNYEEFKQHIISLPRLYCDKEDCESLKIFISPKNLSDHKRDVHGENIHVCDHEGCDKRFTTSSRLTIHKKTHDKNRTRSFQCPDCEKKYFQKAVLNSHIKKHHRKLSSGTQFVVDVFRTHIKSTRISPNQEHVSTSEEQNQIEMLTRKIATLRKENSTLKRKCKDKDKKIKEKDEEIRKKDKELKRLKQVSQVNGKGISGSFKLGGAAKSVKKPAAGK